MEKVRIGIIGQGIISNEHFEGYAARPDEVEVVAICDVDSAALDAASKKWGVKNTYTDFRKMLERDDLDAVDVCLHNNLHAPIACEVMASGKHCYCEKPMAGSYKDAVAMMEASKRYGKMLHIQLGLLYTPETRSARKLINAGKLGNIYHLRSTGYRRRGRPYVDGYARMAFNQSKMAGHGALFDMGVYHISQLLYLTGNPKPLRVSGQIYQELAMDEERKRLSGYDVEELGVGLVKFEKNLTMDIIESWAIHAGPFGGSAICGSEGGICLEPFQYFTSDADLTLTCTAEIGSDEYRNHQLHPEMIHYDSSADHWISALSGKVPLLNTAELALNTMLISEGIFLSGKLGRELSVEEIEELSCSNALRTQDTPIGTIQYKPWPFI